MRGIAHTLGRFGAVVLLLHVAGVTDLTRPAGPDDDGGPESGHLFAGPPDGGPGGDAPDPHAVFHRAGAEEFSPASRPAFLRPRPQAARPASARVRPAAASASNPVLFGVVLQI